MDRMKPEPVRGDGASARNGSVQGVGGSVECSFGHRRIEISGCELFAMGCLCYLAVTLASFEVEEPAMLKARTW